MINSKQIIFRILLSVVLSGIIGIDRENTKKPAGLRTHVLVSLGSTLIMLLSLFLPYSLEGINALTSDRLAAQVVSGIGFLGAGTILRSGTGLVTGLTTAASLWVVAAIGLSVGAGFYLGAVITTILVFIVLTYFQFFEPKVLLKSSKSYSLTIVIENKPGLIFEIDQVFEYLKIHVVSTEIYDYKYNKKIVKKVRIPENEVKYHLLSNISNIDGVIEISEVFKEE